MLADDGDPAVGLDDVNDSGNGPRGAGVEGPDRRAELWRVDHGRGQHPGSLTSMVNLWVPFWTGIGTADVLFPIIFQAAAFFSAGSCGTPIPAAATASAPNVAVRRRDG